MAKKHHSKGMGKAHHGHESHGHGSKDPHASKEHHAMNVEHGMPHGMSPAEEEGEGEGSKDWEGGNEDESKEY